MGRAWSGGGVSVAEVAVGVDGVWSEAALDPPQGEYAWRGWRFRWDAAPGEHVLQCRATDANGDDPAARSAVGHVGFGNNAVHRVHVTVR